MRILVVEDDLEAQRYLVQGLKESGHVVDDAADGDIGLSLALSRPYDVAIIDRMLPKMDGLGVVAEMREHGNATPVLFLSGLKDDLTRMLGRVFGPRSWAGRLQLSRGHGRTGFFFRKQEEVDCGCGQLRALFLSLNQSQRGL